MNVPVTVFYRNEPVLPCTNRQGWPLRVGTVPVERTAGVFSKMQSHELKVQIWFCTQVFTVKGTKVYAKMLEMWRGGGFDRLCCGLLVGWKTTSFLFLFFGLVSCALYQVMHLCLGPINGPAIKKTVWRSLHRWVCLVYNAMIYLRFVLAFIFFARPTCCSGTSYASLNAHSGRFFVSEERRVTSRRNYGQAKMEIKRCHF